MQRCDFASVMGIIREDLMDGAFTGQMDFVETLFSSFTEKCGQDGQEFYFDPGQVNKWFNGLVKISPLVCQFYTMNAGAQKDFSVTLEDAVIPCLSDRAMVISKISDLLTQDPSVSEEKKQELFSVRTKSDAEFLAAVLIFGMGRPFVARDIRKPEKIQSGAKSPSIQDYIFDADVPKPCRNFCGRDAELAELHEALSENGKVFLQGIPGIGKSEIAKAYARLHKKEYTNILYFIYSGDLKHDIADLQFVDDKEKDDEQERFRRHNRFLRTLKEDTLLIIDNFNTTATQEELFPIVMKYACKILFTTKSNFSDRSCVTVEEISDHAILYGLVSSFFRDADKHRETVEAIMETVHYHTLSVELSARLAQCGLLSPEAILAKLREEKAAFNGTDEIKIDKDGQTVRATYYQHIRTLFALFKLDDTQSYTMRCMSLMPLSGISARLFADWSGFTDMNTVNELCELGFIREDDERMLSLHPMMQEVTVADLVPSVTNCRTFLAKIGITCMKHNRDIPYDKLLRQIVKNASVSLKIDDCNWYIRLLEHIDTSMPSVSSDPDRDIVVKELERLLKDETVGEPEDRAMLLHIKALHQKSIPQAVVYMEKAAAMYPEPNERNAGGLFYIHSFLGDLYRRTNKMQLAEKQLQAALDLDAKFGGGQYDKYGELATALANFYNDTGRFAQARELLEPLENKLRRTKPFSDYHATTLCRLAIVIANCGDEKRALSLLDEAWNIYGIVYAEDKAVLERCQQNVLAVRKAILAPKKRPGQYIRGIVVPLSRPRCKKTS